MISLTKNSHQAMSLQVPLRQDTQQKAPEGREEEGREGLQVHGVRSHGGRGDQERPPTGTSGRPSFPTGDFANECSPTTYPSKEKNKKILRRSIFFPPNDFPPFLLEMVETEPGEASSNGNGDERTCLIRSWPRPSGREGALEAGCSGTRLMIGTITFTVVLIVSAPIDSSLCLRAIALSLPSTATSW